jgi:ubiquinone/menaquinone biosynthesis C-methylase UbiE
MDQPEWNDELSRAYVRYMETNVRFDHRSWARRIAADCRDLPAEATVVDVAGGPAFLSLELAPLLVRPRVILADGAALMVELADERAKARGRQIEGHVCPAEQLDLADGVADLVVCKHFLRLAADVDASLREMARILRPGGRAYLVDFNSAGPRLGIRLLTLWIKLTAPPFLRGMFPATVRSGLAATSVPPRVRTAGFAQAELLHAGVSYLVRAVR